MTIGGGVFDPHSFAHSHSHTPASLIIHHYCIRHGNFAFLGPHVSLRNITKEGLGQDTHMGVVHVVFVERKGGVGGGILKREGVLHCISSIVQSVRGFLYSPRAIGSYKTIVGIHCRLIIFSILYCEAFTLLQSQN